MTCILLQDQILDTKIIAKSLIIFCMLCSTNDYFEKL